MPVRRKVSPISQLAVKLITLTLIIIIITIIINIIFTIIIIIIIIIIHASSTQKQIVEYDIKSTYPKARKSPVSCRINRLLISYLISKQVRLNAFKSVLGRASFCLLLDRGGKKEALHETRQSF